MTLRKVSTPNFLTEKLRSSSLGLGLRIRVRVFFRMCYLLKFTSECEQKGPGLLQLVTSDSGFPDGSVVKNLPANAGRTGNKSLIPGSGRAPEEGNGTPLQFSCLENSMDRGAWQATGHRVTTNQIQLSERTHRQHQTSRGG